MDDYYLFLDESLMYGNLKYFVLAGIFIKADVYKETLVPAINKLKLDVFGNSNVILHEIELRKREKAPYDVLKKPEQNKMFWDGILKIFSEVNFRTIGAGVNCSIYKQRYSEYIRNSEYTIALRLIMENFVHFLESTDGKGTLYLESVNSTSDQHLSELYYNIISDGSLFIKNSTFQKRLATINFPIKTDNTIGLQMADLIPNPLNRNFSHCKEKNPSLLGYILDKLYDGGNSEKDRFGFKIID